MIVCIFVRQSPLSWYEYMLECKTYLLTPHVCSSPHHVHGVKQGHFRVLTHLFDSTPTFSKDFIMSVVINKVVQQRAPLRMHKVVFDISCVLLSPSTLHFSIISPQNTDTRMLNMLHFLNPEEETNCFLDGPIIQARCNETCIEVVYCKLWSGVNFLYAESHHWTQHTVGQIL